MVLTVFIVQEVTECLPEVLIRCFCVICDKSGLQTSIITSSFQAKTCVQVKPCKISPQR